MLFNLQLLVKKRMSGDERINAPPVCIFQIIVALYQSRTPLGRFLCIGWSDGDGDGRIFQLSSCGRVGASVGVYAVFGKGSSHGGKGRESKRSQEGCGKSFMVHG